VTHNCRPRWHIQLTRYYPITKFDASLVRSHKVGHNAVDWQKHLQNKLSKMTQASDTIFDRIVSEYVVSEIIWKLVSALWRRLSVECMQRMTEADVTTSKLRSGPEKLKDWGVRRSSGNPALTRMPHSWFYIPNTHTTCMLCSRVHSTCHDARSLTQAI